MAEMLNLIKRINRGRITHPPIHATIHAICANLKTWHEWHDWHECRLGKRLLGCVATVPKLLPELIQQRAEHLKPILSTPGAIREHGRSFRALDRYGGRDGDKLSGRELDNLPE